MSFIYVSCKNPNTGDGSKNNPFRTIGQAARIARGGDTVIIGGGVYREWVNPQYGGISERERIVYRAADGEKPIISGAEVVSDWRKEDNGIWTTVIDNRMFGEINPFNELISGDWFDGWGREHHTAEVYLDGKALFEASGADELLSTEKNYWIAHVDNEKTILHACFGDVNPNEHLTEVNVRESCFFPKRTGVNYITLSGLEFCCAASQWAPPTAFQSAAVGTHWSKGWIIENCSIHDSKCCGISIGKSYDANDNDWVRNARKGGAQTYTEIIMDAVRHGWSKETVGSHYIHNNHIYNCGQTGIVGNMGSVYSRITDNHIHDINTRGEFGGAEIAGIKLHAAIDVHLENNCIHHCTRGLWLDWEAQGARVTRNTFFENGGGEDFFIEVCHGPCVIDNNLFLSKNSYLSVSQGSALINNLFAGAVRIRRETARFTLYHFPHETFVAGSMVVYSGDDRVIGNIFVGENSGTSDYRGYPPMRECKLGEGSDSPYHSADETMPTEIRNNVYINGAQSCESDVNAQHIDKVLLKTELRDGKKWFLTLNIADSMKRFPTVTTSQLGKAFETNQWYENPDGSDICIDKDYSGKKRPSNEVLPGPFETLQTELCLNQ